MQKIIEEFERDDERYVIYYNVSFSEREDAKKLGAKWDARKKLWFGLDDNKELKDKFKIYKPLSFYCGNCYTNFSRKEVHRESVLVHSFYVGKEFVTELIQCYICTTCRKKEKKEQKDLQELRALRTQQQIDLEMGMQESVNR